MSGTNVWRYIGAAVLVVGALLCVSYANTQYNGYKVQENNNFVILHENLQKMQEQMIEMHQQVSDMAKSISEVKGKVEAPVRIEKVEKQVFYFY